MAEDRVSFCRICEAMCGVIASVEDGKLVSLRADRDNPYSKGFMCTKGVAMAQVVNDDDRVTVPLKRTGGPGEFTPTTWQEALSDVASRLATLRRDLGPDSIAISVGNPLGFTYSGIMWSKNFQKAIGTPWYYGINSEDAAARLAACKILYGRCAHVPIPDYRNTDVFVVIGANPWVSKGSAVVDARIREHMTDIVARGGRVIVIDPRRTETARTFEHLPVRAGTDAWLLLSVLHVLVKHRLCDESFVRQWTTGFDTFSTHLERFAPSDTEPITGVSAHAVVELAEAIGHAKSAVVYGRTGTCTQKFGTLVNILQDFINIVTGNLQRPGGWVWAWSPVPIGAFAEMTGMATYGQTHTRVSGLPDCIGVLPSNALADDISTPGKGQIRGMVLLASNIVVSSPDGIRLSNALAGLDTFVSLDLYINESNRYADYILPVTTMYEREDLLGLFADKQIRPSLQATEAVIEPIGDCRQEWEILNEIASRMGLGSADPTWLQRRLARVGLRIHPRWAMDLLVRIGKSGDWFGLRRSGWSWQKLIEQAPHGVVLHERPPLEPLKKFIHQRNRKIPMDDPRIMSELSRLQTQSENTEFPMRLIGMREMRSHNSWMHNSARLMPESRQHTLRINPADARRIGLANGDVAEITSKTGSVAVPVTLTDDLIAGTVALPHGWGHEGGWRRANSAGGTNSNLLASSRPTDLEKLAAMTVLNGIPVRVERAREPGGASAP